MPRVDPVIAPTSRIAGLCHSILRGEPYDTCMLSCAYCYARWYRGPHGEPRPLRGSLEGIRLAHELAREHGILLPVRIATLSDPFQPVESKYRASLRLLRYALKRGVPVILNTRLPPPSRRHRRVLRDLASSNLLLVQVTLTGHERVWRLLRRLEPYSPSPRERLGIAYSYAGLGAPVMVRLQPFMPGLTDRLVEDLLDGVRIAEARGVIFEAIRGEPELLERLPKPALYPGRLHWCEYAEGARIRHPCWSYLLSLAGLLSRLSKARSLAFQTCKEGLFHLHHPSGMDCCGTTLLGPRIWRRPHLWDVYLALREAGRPLEPEEAFERACRRRERLACGERLEGVKGYLGVMLRAHERRLKRILARGDVLEKLTPLMRVEEGLLHLTWPLTR